MYYNGNYNFATNPWQQESHYNTMTTNIKLYHYDTMDESVCHINFVLC